MDRGDSYLSGSAGRKLYLSLSAESAGNRNNRGAGWKREYGQKKTQGWLLPRNSRFATDLSAADLVALIFAAENPVVYVFIQF
jgi:hypothetical protein